MLGPMGLHPIQEVLQSVHLAGAWSSLLIGGIYLVERRGKKVALHPKRQIDLTTLMQSIPEAALIIDTKGKVVDANSAAAELLRSQREKMLGENYERLSQAINTGSNGQRHNPIFDRALKGIPVQAERRLVRTSVNGEVELLVSATPMRNEQGEVIAALIIARDITELTALQHRIGAVERHLAIGQMAAALAHDFNNILTAIGQAAYILESAKTSEDQRHKHIGVIQNAVRRGAEIIARVREYIRTGVGVLEPVDIRQLMGEAIELTNPLSARAGVRVRSELKDVPLARANAADLRRVFTNIIINAIEAMPKGGEMSVSCYREGDHIVATVSDTGMGIAPENQGKVFFPYFTTKQEGTGLGLSGAQKILLAQGGNIHFRTELGKGTTFIVILPMAKDGHAPAPAAREKPAA
jgi:two-component system cell cycle sensor histidine kinase/response regulator CckA